MEGQKNTDSRLFYDQKWNDWESMIDSSPAPAHRRRIIRKLIEPVGSEISSVADIGCGNGRLLQQLNLQWKGSRQLTGMDVSQAIIEKNRLTFSGSKNMQWKTLQLPDEPIRQKFDLVIASEVLEHIEDWQAAFYQMVEASTRYLIVTVPAGKIFPIDSAMGHFRHFNREMLADVLKPLNVKFKIYYWGFPFHMLYKNLINISADAAYNRFAAKKYSAVEKTIARCVHLLFYLNLFTAFRTNQLFIFIKKPSVV